METLLDKYKGHFTDISSLYDYQKDVLERLSRHLSTLAIIPTGGGKSLIYQLMAMELEGITLVISPLIALMQEQVNELNNERNISAFALNSDLSFEDQRGKLRNLDPSCKLIYVSPERLQNAFFRSALVASSIKIAMIVVDEAHCISQWGSGFRPDYGQINGFVEFLKKKKQSPFLLCLTATLSKLARNDIALEFNISPENIVIKDIIRANLTLHFEKVDDENEKSAQLRSFLIKYNPKKTVAYLYSKKKCEEYAKEFSDTYRTDYYHADIELEDRTIVHKNFTQNGIDLLFATTAFGMGINIPDIESVVHLQIPNSVEEYYQQVGRGWRKKSLFKECHCLALWSEINFDRRKKEIVNQKYTTEQLHDAYRALLGGAKITTIGQVVNKDKEALIGSSYNLLLLKYKLEKLNIIRTIGEINGSPLTIELYMNTPLWDKILETANGGFDSFCYVSDELGVSIASIMEHLFEQDLIGNIKKLPAMKKDIYFEVLALKLDDSIAEQIVAEINSEVDFRAARLDDLKELFTCENKEEKLIRFLS